MRVVLSRNPRIPSSEQANDDDERWHVFRLEWIQIWSSFSDSWVTLTDRHWIKQVSFKTRRILLFGLHSRISKSTCSSSAKKVLPKLHANFETSEIRTCFSLVSLASNLNTRNGKSPENRHNYQTQSVPRYFVCMCVCVCVCVCNDGKGTRAWRRFSTHKVKRETHCNSKVIQLRKKCKTTQKWNREKRHRNSFFCKKKSKRGAYDECVQKE